MKCKYRENPTKALFLEALYQDHVINTLAIVLQEKREGEKSHLPGNEGDFKEKKDNQVSEEIF